MSIALFTNANSRIKSAQQGQDPLEPQVFASLGDVLAEVPDTRECSYAVVEGDLQTDGQEHVAVRVLPQQAEQNVDHDRDPTDEQSRDGRSLEPGMCRRELPRDRPVDAHRERAA